MRWISKPEEIKYMCKKNKELADATKFGFYIISITTLDGKQHEGIHGGGASGNNGPQFSQFYSTVCLWTLNGNIDIDVADIKTVFSMESKEEYQKYIDAGIIVIAPSL